MSTNFVIQAQNIPLQAQFHPAILQDLLMSDWNELLSRALSGTRTGRLRSDAPNISAVPRSAPNYKWEPDIREGIWDSYEFKRVDSMVWA
jgi:hypothetical protein